MSGALSDVGSLGEVVSGSIARKMKPEHLRRMDGDKDHSIDLIYMRRDNNWNTFLQKLGSPQEIYLH